MFQKSEVGKYRNKQSVFDAKKDKSFVTPQNRTYKFDYRIDGRKYIIILIYNGYRMQVNESTYNTTDTDILLKSMETI